ncbi:hypothetical protein SAMN05216296_3020 [Pseudomonas pohangensis]|jgi:hypothetical protein|uniref:C-type lysozyme inhibitor domain-containing protein n=1 Tax=Pseudomonas pohangensis TaxID=364197 RepID=A0A1H2HI85_9PSED|nr:hypothetical protein [Pseudomonas pohangensis]SDU31449.1 hypothetical protein SAMN05216296_3020 [Pseudomonas pohangensis]
MAKYLLLMTLSLLSACSFEIQPEPQGAWNEWICDSQAKVYWRPDGADGQSVQVRVGAGDMLHVLKRMPGDNGELYSDSELAFVLQGDHAEVYAINGHTIFGRNCKAQPE